MKSHKFSLVLCTVGSTDYVKSFLHSLVPQTFKNFELIIVEQNDDQRIFESLENPQSNIAVTHIKSEKRLPKSRNAGLNYISGDLVVFPDDDCVYPKDPLQKVNYFFFGKDFDVLTIKMTNSFPTGRRV